MCKLFGGGSSKGLLGRVELACRKFERSLELILKITILSSVSHRLREGSELLLGEVEYPLLPGPNLLDVDSIYLRFSLL